MDPSSPPVTKAFVVEGIANDNNGPDSILCDNTIGEDDELAVS
jgi:hypothetical protein